MIVYIMTDMEGLAGIDHWDQCYDPDDHSPIYQYGREQLTAEANAAIAGCFDAGATEVRICDGHGRNQNKGFIRERLDPRGRIVWITAYPVRLEGMDESVSAVIVIGQHAMAGTINGFLDHTQQPKEVCRFLINGQEHGELSQMALYAGAYNVPVVHVSGDEACCNESRRLFPHAGVTPTKRGTGWATCELYPAEKVRKELRSGIAESLRRRRDAIPWRLPSPITVECEWSYSKRVDDIASVSGVVRTHARIAHWTISNPLDISTWPNKDWSPG